MEPLQAWGAPTWSLAPTADALSLALVLVLLGCPHYAQAMSLCKQDEYPVGDHCCPKCRPGHRVKEACKGNTNTLCVACAAGTYTAHLNGLDECLQCRVCDPDMGLVTRQKCSSTADTVCGCVHGHFCVSHDGDECAMCRPHSGCRPGQRVLERGTEKQDTVCEDCPPGTFSPNGTLEVCQPWTKCSGLFEVQEEPGTSSTDVACSSWALWLLLSFILSIFLMLTVLVTVRNRLCGGPTQKRWLSQGKRQQAERDAVAAQILGVSRVVPDVTTVAVEETASMFPKRDQTADEWPQGTAV